MDSDCNFMKILRKEGAKGSFPSLYEERTFSYQRQHSEWKQKRTHPTEYRIFLANNLVYILKQGVDAANCNFSIWLLFVIHKLFRSRFRTSLTVSISRLSLDVDCLGGFIALFWWVYLCPSNWSTLADVKYTLENAHLLFVLFVGLWVECMHSRYEPCPA